jgi:hypothetical protein
VKHEVQTAANAEEPAIFGFPRSAEKKPAAGVKPAVKEEGQEKKSSGLAFLSGDDEPKEAAKSAGTGVIALAIAPWGEVYVDGDRVGVSPPVNEVEVAPGKRKVEIRNGSFPVYTQVVEVKADQKVRIKHKFN